MIVAVDTGSPDHHVVAARRDRRLRVEVQGSDPRQEPESLARSAAPDASREAHRVPGGHVDQVDLVVELRSEEHTSELQSHHDLVCRLLLEKKKKNNTEALL